MVLKLRTAGHNHLAGVLKAALLAEPDIGANAAGQRRPGMPVAELVAG